jgi:hypothetical protein
MRSTHSAQAENTFYSWNQFRLRELIPQCSTLRNRMTAPQATVVNLITYVLLLLMVPGGCVDSFHLLATPTLSEPFFNWNKAITGK